MQNKEILSKMVKDCLNAKSSLLTLSGQIIGQGKNKTLVKNFILENKTVPMLKPFQYGTQAGTIIGNQLQDGDLELILNSHSNALPAALSNRPYFNLLKTSPAAFLSSLIIAEENPESSNAIGQWIREKSKSVLEFAKETAGNLGEFIQEKGDQAGQLFKTGAFVIPRGAFLSLLLINFRGMATKMGLAIEKNEGKVREFWTLKFGGNMTELKNVVNKAKSKKPFLGEKKVSNVAGEEVLAILAQAAPIIAVAVPLFKNVLGEKGDKAIDDAVAIYEKGTGTDTGLERSTPSTSGGGNFPEIGAIQTPWGNINWGVTNNKGALLYIGIGAVVLISILYFLTKKK